LQNPEGEIPWSMFTLHFKGEKVKQRIPEILAVILLVLAFLGLVHQQLVSNDVWFHYQQLKNHETIVSCFVIAAVALVAGKYLGRHK
jgi:uncharacterized membrane protein